jgi:SAM-dependent methyltransferase
MNSPRSQANSPADLPEARPGHTEFGPIAPFYDELMQGVPYRQWVDYIERIVERHSRTPGRVLDLACGTGQVGCEMLRRGYDVIGVDLAEPMTRACSQQTPPMAAAVMDAARLGLRAESLDLVVSLYDSLNYILDPAGLQACFESVYDALRPGGLLLFDLNTIRALRIGLFTQNNLGSDEPLQFAWTPEWDPRTRLCQVTMWFNWRGEGGPRQFTEVHYQRGYTTREVQAMLRLAGFAQTTVYHAYTFRRPTRWSDRVFHVAEKSPRRER